MKTLIALLYCLCAMDAALGADPVLKVAGNQATRAYESALVALYKEAGLVPEFVYLPPERALKSLERGQVDADFARVVGATAGYQNMVELTEPISETTLLAVVRKGSAITALSPSGLKLHQVGLLRGTKMAEGLMAKQGALAIVANTTPQLYDMLIHQRFEVALTSSAVPVPEEFASSVTVLAQPLATAKLVHVLCKKWRAYGPKLDAALKTLKSDGRWSRLLAQAPLAAID